MGTEPRGDIESSADGPAGRSVSNDHLDELLHALWPAPALITRPGWASRSTPGTSDFVAVPNDVRPTLLLPRRPRRVTAAGLLNYKSSARGRARLKLQLMAAATRFGAADLLRSRVRIERAPLDGQGGIDEYLSVALHLDLYVCLYIGVPRAVQKPVLQLLSPDGVPLGFAKVGTNPLTRQLVRGEGDTLRSLAGHTWSRLRIPTVLHQGQWHHHEVLVLEALTPIDRGDFDDLAMSEAMVELASSRGVTAYRVTQSPYWRRLHTRVSALSSSRYVDTISSVLSRSEPTAAATLLDFGSWHGDFAPWNMSFSRSRVNVWDWEQFEPDVPLGFDALHFHAQRALVRDSRSPQEAMESALLAAPDLLAPFGVAAPASDLVGLLYVLEIALRYLHDGELDAGTRMGRLQSWLEPVTTRHLDRLQRGVPQ
jgi:hypothetical protein